MSIGNSYSDDGLSYMFKICESVGIKCILGVAYIGGSSLQTHYNCAINNTNSYIFNICSNYSWKSIPNYTLKQCIGYTDWDIVTFQQVSSQSGTKASTDIYLPFLISFVKNGMNNKPRFAWIMT